MKTHIASATIAAAALACSLMLASTAMAAAIHGTVQDSYRRTKVASITVTLFDADGEGSQIASTTTAADGTYHFTGLAAARYYLYFSDASDRYWPAWYDQEPEYFEADPVKTHGSVDTTANMALDPEHPKYATQLSTATVSAGGTTTVSLGDSVTLETTATDFYWHYPASSVHMTLQTSTDQTTWTDVEPALDPDWVGTYSATFTPKTRGAYFYRFSIADAIDAEATSSASVRVNVVVPMTSWQGATFASTVATDVTAPSAWQTLTISARLVDGVGLPKTGVGTVLQGSADGVNWVDSPPSAVTSAANGWYSAHVVSGVWTFYRFAFYALDGQLSSVSQPVTLRSPWALSWTQLTRTVSRNKKFTVAGVVWPPTMSPSKLVWVEVDHYAHKKWSVVRSGWVTARRAATSTTFSLVLTIKSGGDSRIRASVPRGDAYRMPQPGSWYYIYAK